MRTLTVDQLIDKVMLLIQDAPNMTPIRLAVELGDIRASLVLMTTPGKSPIKTVFPGLSDKVINETGVVQILDVVVGHLASAMAKAGELPVGGIQSATHHNIYHTTQTALALADFARRQY